MIDFKNNIPGLTPLYRYQDIFGIKSLYVKDESKNPTNTFKDRLAFAMLKPIVNDINNGIKPTKTTFCSISYGNTAYSMGYYCNLLNAEYKSEIVNAVVIIPLKFSEKFLGPDTNGKIIKGSEVINKLSDFCRIIEYDLDNEILDSTRIVSIVQNSGYALDKIIDITEGIDNPAYEPIISEVIEKQLEQIPDYIIVPFGAGILCNEIIDYVASKGLKSKIIPVSTGNPNSIATMLYGPIWVDTNSLLNLGFGYSKQKGKDKKGNIRTPYKVFNVSDYQILKALQNIENPSFSSEPSALAAFGILENLKTIDNSFDANLHSVLVINTGNGLLNYSSDFTSIENQIKNTLTIDTEIEHYVVDTNKVKSQFDIELIRKMHPYIDDDILQITTIQAQFISYLLKTNKPKLILDIGTYKGYSATCMALNTEIDTKIITLEINQNYAIEASAFFKLFGLADKIECINGNAIESMKSLSNKGYKGMFDFIFLDADKESYLDYYDLSIELLKEGGILAIDNTLLFGTIVGKDVQNTNLSKYASKEGIETIKSLNNRIKFDTQVDYCLLPISDGFTLVTKK
jgi:predicted O-methyltransferase YrrM/threonine dehydratase